MLDDKDTFFDASVRAFAFTIGKNNRLIASKEHCGRLATRSLMLDLTNPRRRCFLQAASVGTALVATGLGLIDTAQAQATPVPSQPVSSGGVATPMAPLRQVRAGVLDIGYYETGPSDGLVVLLLHGYPYDIHSYVEVAPMLAAQGCRVIAPYLRGHGSTRFLDAATPRAGQQGAIGADVIALMDSLNISTAVLAGFDWGGRAACVAAALWPERCEGLVSVNSYLIQDIAHAMTPIPAQNELSGRRLTSARRAAVVSPTEITHGLHHQSQ